MARVAPTAGRSPTGRSGEPSRTAYNGGEPARRGEGEGADGRSERCPRAGVPPAQQAPPAPLRPLAGPPRLGQPARPLPHLRRRPAGRTAACSPTPSAPPTPTCTPRRASAPAVPTSTRSPSCSSWRWGCRRGRSTAARAGRCAATRPAATSTRPRATPSCRRCRASRRASTTTSAATTRLERRRAFAADEAARLAAVLPPGRSWSGCRRSTGARRGSTACGPSATASTTSATPSPPSATRRRRSAGRPGCSTTSAMTTCPPWLGLDRERLRRRSIRSTANIPTPSSWSALPSCPLACPTCRQPSPTARWLGRANRSVPSHVPWEAIDEVAEATAQAADAGGDRAFRRPPCRRCRRRDRPIPAATLIRQRRSCLALDGRTSLDAATFYRMLDRLLPRPDVPPWDAAAVAAARPRRRLRPPRPRPGAGTVPVRALARGPRRACRPPARRRSAGSGPRAAPNTWRFYLLAAGDYRERGADGELPPGHRRRRGLQPGHDRGVRRRRSASGGPWWYRRLFWEAGVLGQVLYLEAEAAGVRGTGIGCYFDDACHQLLGLTRRRLAGPVPLHRRRAGRGPAPAHPGAVRPPDAGGDETCAGPEGL